MLGIGPKTQSINSLDKNVLQGLRRDLHAKRYITREQNRARKTYRECRKRQLQSREPTYTTMEIDQQATIALEPFQYSRLLYTDSIRLLILEPGEPFEKLVFRMELTGLTRTPRAYTAVSYVWGNPNTQKVLSFLENKERQVILSFTLTAGLSSRVEEADFEERDLDDFVAFVQAQELEIGTKFQGRQPGRGDMKRFQTVAMLACNGKKLIFDDSDRLTLAPEATHVGDWVCILADGDIPFVLRPYGDYFYLVGECYHHDYMGGLFGSNNNAKARAALAKQTFEIH